MEGEIQRLLDEDLLPYLVAAVGAVGMAAWEWWRLLVPTPPKPVLVTGLALLFVAYVAHRACRVLKQARRLRLGADGERVVGEELEDLRARGCRVLHDVPGQGFNLDHVVLSRRGLYVIETKTLSKPQSGNPVITFDGERLLIDGREPPRDFLAQAAAQRSWLRDWLHQTTGRRFPVRSVLVFPGWFVQNTRRTNGSDLWVLNPKALPRFLDYEPEVVSPEDLALVHSRLAKYVRDHRD